MKPYLFTLLLLISITGFAAELPPCSGNKGGIHHCEGSKFICNDGKASGSKKDCTAFMGQTPTATASSTALPPSIVQQVATPPEKLMRLDYEGFTVWLDCEKRGAVKFQYNAQRDNGSLPREEKFALDPNVPAPCQQTTANAYGHGYDRGHLVPANHLDYSAAAIKATNNMTNILPQAANMNRGAWLETEELIECYRDISELLVIGGVIWGNNPADDYFVKSHGVKTPDAYWKVVIRGSGQNEQAIAWIVPNSQEAIRKNVNQYLVTVHDIERITGEKIPVAEYAKDTKPAASWTIPLGCNKG